MQLQTVYNTFDHREKEPNSYYDKMASLLDSFQAKKKQRKRWDNGKIDNRGTLNPDILNLQIKSSMKTAQKLLLRKPNRGKMLIKVIDNQTNRSKERKRSKFLCLYEALLIFINYYQSPIPGINKI